MSSQFRIVFRATIAFFPAPYFLSLCLRCHFTTNASTSCTIAFTVASYASMPRTVARALPRAGKSEDWTISGRFAVQRKDAAEIPSRFLRSAHPLGVGSSATMGV